MRIDLALAYGWPGAQWTLLGNDYAGLTWLDQTVAKPTEAELSAAWGSMPSPVPQIVTRRQAKRALLAAGLLSTVETAVSGASAEVQIDWADALEFRRDNPTIAALAAALGLTSAQVDDLFRAAATL